MRLIKGRFHPQRGASAGCEFPVVSRPSPRSSTTPISCRVLAWSHHGACAAGEPGRHRVIQAASESHRRGERAPKDPGAGCGDGRRGEQYRRRGSATASTSTSTTRSKRPTAIPNRAPGRHQLRPRRRPPCRRRAGHQALTRPNQRPIGNAQRTGGYLTTSRRRPGQQRTHHLQILQRWIRALAALLKSAHRNGLQRSAVPGKGGHNIPQCWAKSHIACYGADILTRSSQLPRKKRAIRSSPDPTG